MRVRLAVLAAASAAATTCSLLVGVGEPAQADGPETGTALPAGPVGTSLVGGVHVADDVVYATWGADSLTAALYRTPADGSGSWQPVVDPDTSAPIVRPAAVGDGFVVPQPTSGGGCQQWRVVTPSSAWTIPAPQVGCNLGVVVGTGPLLAVKREDATGKTVYDVYDTTAGPGGGVVDEAPYEPPALDGTWVLSTAVRMWAVDSSGQHATFSVPLPATCFPGSVSAASGDPTTADSWALVQCQHSTQQVVVPLDGGVPLALPTGAWHLGDGFVYETEAGPSGNEVRVMDFSAGLTQHVYGPVSLATGSGSGTPRVVWTHANEVDTVALGWLGTGPTKAEDDTPPEVSLTAPPAAVRFTGGDMSLSFSWGATDAGSGPVLYDAEERDSRGPGWGTIYSDSTWTLRTSATTYPGEPQTVCVRVRAEDRAGNVSAWTKKCTRTDSVRPTMRFQNGALHPVFFKGLGPAVERFPLQGFDDGPIAAYQVQRRSAVAGHALGAWRTPLKWRAVDASSVTRRLGRQRELCFRTRATDQVGRVSGWSRPWCQTTPYDDRELVAHGGRRLRGSDYLGGTATALGGHGSLTLSGVSGREVWVKARGGEALECPIVSWGGKPFFGYGHPCGNPVGSKGGKWFAWRVRRVRHGTIRITSPTWDPLTVDAVAVVR